MARPDLVQNAETSGKQRFNVRVTPASPQSFPQLVWKTAAGFWASSRIVRVSETTGGRWLDLRRSVEHQRLLRAVHAGRGPVAQLVAAVGAQDRGAGVSRR